MNGAQKLPSRAWLVVGLLWFTGCLNYLDRVTITTMRESLVSAIPMSDAQFGLLTSVFLWVYGLLSPFAGYFADRFGRAKVIVLSLLAWSLITWLTAHARTFDQLLATRALMGISEACYLPAALALIADYHRGTTRSLATGIQMSGIMIGSGLGGVGGWIAERSTWSHAFILFGSVGIVFSAIVALLLRDRPVAGDTDSHPDRSPMGLGESVVELFRHGSFILALLFWGLLGLASWGVVGWMPTYLTSHFHLSQGAGGLSATGFLQGAALAGVLVGGIWADRWKRTNPRARILVPFIGLCIAAPAILLTSVTDLLHVTLLGLVLYGFARSFTDSNMMPILCDLVDERTRATGYGVLNLFSCLIGGLTIYAGGLLRDAHVSVGLVFKATALCLVVCAAILLWLKPRRAASD
ncbi:putative galactarate transporter [mine drainage metagenome]|uniref:Putative galactarate transporter n=1 Tax=mine drainage metagenome TaxID=410659 RepID=A0A1J5S6L2_9ZZZZ